MIEHVLTMRTLPLFALLGLVACSSSSSTGGNSSQGAGGSTTTSSHTSTSATGAGGNGSSTTGSTASTSGGTGGAGTGGAATGGAGTGGMPFTPGQPITAPAGQWTWVPFGNAFCANGTTTGIGVNMSSTPDARVLFYFEGGGACWNDFTCYTIMTASYFTTGYGESDFAAESADTTYLALPGGFFDRTAAANPFKDYNYVYVPYCTGDIHGGDNIMKYTSAHVAHHVGFKNVTAYLERLVPTFPNADRVIIAGQQRRRLRRGVQLVADAAGVGAARRGSTCSTTRARPCLRTSRPRAWARRPSGARGTSRPRCPPAAPSARRASPACSGSTSSSSRRTGSRCSPTSRTRCSPASSGSRRQRSSRA